MGPMNGALLEAALRYADLGYPVFPCAPGGKSPITEHGFRDASTDPKQIEHWWTQTPTANIGLPTENLLVVDIDGADNSWLVEQPDRRIDLAVGPMARTPRGGRHHLFRRPVDRAWRCTESRLAPSVDTRTAGGYIVVPPSVSTQGAGYEWVPDQDLDVSVERLPEPPAWLAEELDRVDPIVAQFAHGGACGGQRRRRQPDPPGPAQRHPGPTGGHDAPGRDVPRRNRRGARTGEPRPLPPALG
jgi:hypothetical protein